MKKKQTTISGLIFSFDRAMQLDAVLKSFFRHCKDSNQAELTVLYKVSSELYNSQYLSLAQEYPQVNFHLQNSFWEDALFILLETSSSFFKALSEDYIKLFKSSRKSKVFKAVFNQYVRKAILRLLPYESDKYMLFLVDDNIFTNDFSLESIINQLQQHKKALGFSLRLGENTTYCYPHRTNQKTPVFFNVTDNILQFDWTKAEHDFTYPLEVSSSIYRASQIFPILLNYSFSTPNSLEDLLASKSNRFKKACPFLLCFKTSVTFCAPINIVQKAIDNRSGLNREYSVESLCNLYSAGKRINTNMFNQFIPNGCHQEVEIFFEDQMEVK